MKRFRIRCLLFFSLLAGSSSAMAERKWLLPWTWFEGSRKETVQDGRWGEIDTSSRPVNVNYVTNTYNTMVQPPQIAENRNSAVRSNPPAARTVSRQSSLNGPFQPERPLQEWEVRAWVKKPVSITMLNSDGSAHNGVLRAGDVVIGAMDGDNLIVREKESCGNPIISNLVLKRGQYKLITSVPEEVEECNVSQSSLWSLGAGSAVLAYGLASNEEWAQIAGGLVAGVNLLDPKEFNLCAFKKKVPAMAIGGGMGVLLDRGIKNQQEKRDEKRRRAAANQQQQQYPPITYPPPPGPLPPGPGPLPTNTLSHGHYDEPRVTHSLMLSPTMFPAASPAASKAKTNIGIKLEYAIHFSFPRKRVAVAD